MACSSPSNRFRARPEQRLFAGLANTPALLAALLRDLPQLLFFLGLFLGVERLLIARDQLPVRAALKGDHVVGFGAIFPELTLFIETEKVGRPKGERSEPEK
jgi:hypothetical protein